MEERPGERRNNLSQLTKTSAKRDSPLPRPTGPFWDRVEPIPTELRERRGKEIAVGAGGGHNWNVQPRGFFLCAFLGLAWLTPARGQENFSSRVWPLLESRCLSCHGPDKAKGGLRLDSRAALLKGGENGPAVVPGNPQKSLLLQSVLHASKDLEMPPKEKLGTNDIRVLRRWIEDGAPWPETMKLSAAPIPVKAGERIGDAWSDARNPIVRIFGGQRLDLWSLRPVRATEPPSVRWKKRVSNPIDSFVEAKLEAAGKSMSSEADRRTLARRLYFDLTGLPPGPDDVEHFVNDRSPDAYAQLVERLLASPRYGEHMARQWMDVVRYSDSNGFDWDEFRPRAWRFRDYLVRSFNQDKSYDQMVREQLAGDELVPGEPANAAEQDALIATGFLRLGPHDNSAGSFNEQDRSRAELLADLTETTGAAFLGLTLSCNRCHDHKYDPLSQADHYRLRAFFEPVKFADDLPLDLAAEQKLIREGNRGIAEQLKPVTTRRDALTARVKKKLRQEKIARLDPAERQLLETPEAERAAKKEKIDGVEKKVEIRDKEVQAALTPAEKKDFDAWAAEITELKKKERPFSLGLLMTDKSDPVPVTRIFFQGNHKDPRDAVEPGFPSILDPNPAALRRPPNPHSSGRRLTLAEWIVAPENPLTARVLVNRVWQNHFGRGLVATPNDFGLGGARPSHPELLDWLATRFTAGGWSIKNLHRLIVTSSAYRQASQGPGADENLLLGRQNPRRLSAEQLRDSLLAVSGMLNLEHRGGPPIWPELPPEILQANPAFLDDNAEKTKGWYASARTNQNVRSLYLVQKRTVRVPFLETFDQPENSLSCPRRSESIVAPQALALLNGALSVEVARGLARRVEAASPPEPRARIEALFGLALQRGPTSDERRRCLKFLQDHSVAELARVVLNLNEFIFVD